MIVAIDGPAGSGKSTIAREIAARLGFSKLDTGAMYRCVALAALERGIACNDAAGIGALAGALSIEFGAERAGNVAVYLDGRDVSDAIRTPAVDRTVSAVAANPAVRTAMLAPQRAFARGRDVVAEGRDIGSVVFPAAELKVFLTADPRERARRRVLQRHAGAGVDAAALEAEIAQTLSDIERRDAADAGRAAAPLVCPPDAVRIDSTASTIDQIVSQIAELVAARR